jgi:miniconductance mechanosensitive channel
MKEFIINWIKSFYALNSKNSLDDLLSNPEFTSHKIYWTIGLFLSMVFLSLLIWYFTRQILLGIVYSFAAKTKTIFDDKLVENKFFGSFSHLLPLLFMDYFFSIVLFAFPHFLNLAIRFNEVLIALVLLVSTRRMLNAFGDLLKSRPALEGKPINSYIQTVKIIVSIVFIIIMLSLLTNQSPVFFLTSLGAMTAILLLVFKDTILGFVGSIQLSANDMVRVGDWVTVEKYGADGDVIEINLTTVKIQNFDKTITTIPTYSFISDSFKNWRGMSESDGRRIKRAIKIQIDSVKFASPELLEKLEKVTILSDFLKKTKDEIDAFNLEHGLTDENQIHARKQTNIGLFRGYLEHYLKHNPEINTKMTLMVRQLAPTEYGVPIEIYCFTKSKEWIQYEIVMADIFDHVFSIVKKFELRVFENPSGSDFSKMVNS